MATTLSRRDLAVHSTAFIVVVVVIGVVVANLLILFTWLLVRHYRRRNTHTRAPSPPPTNALHLRTSVHSDTKRRPGTGNSSTSTRPSSAFSNSALAEKLGPLMPPRAHITAPAPILLSTSQPPAQRTRSSTSSRPSFDRSPHLTPVPPRRSNSSRRSRNLNVLSPSASLRRAAGTPSAMSVADSASVYSTASAFREDEDGDVISSLPRVREGWRWRPRSRTPVLVLRDFEDEERGMAV
ncbi:unnamed protein product [Peniophora sp. CBMAI 1063]|nr:unnamed protein product [Peniophora sp. CBMAI 1063]